MTNLADNVLGGLEISVLCSVSPLVEGNYRSTLLWMSEKIGRFKLTSYLANFYTQSCSFWPVCVDIGCLVGFFEVNLIWIRTSGVFV